MDIRAVAWNRDAERLVLLDQTRLPGEVVYLPCDDVDTLVAAIQRLVVRGAPALGVAGAYGVALAMVQARRESWDDGALDDAVARVRDARPTAVNLADAVDRVAALRGHGLDRVLAEAAAVADEDERANRKLSRLGADWIVQRVGTRPLRLLTHCNTGALATSAWGTALGIVRELNARAMVEVVYVDETRPLLQGTRLTAWELEQEGIPYLVQADGAAASTMQRGLVDVAVVGADRIARNGDSANKIGTLGVALGARYAGIPFVVAAPSSTVDPATASGSGIPVEMRAEEEVLSFGDTAVAPARARGSNPAFDVTPWALIDAIVTEHGVVEPDGADVVAVLRGAG
jgi:methylthioribose-1-phosphate isomerase